MTLEKWGVTTENAGVTTLLGVMQPLSTWKFDSKGPVV